MRTTTLWIFIFLAIICGYLFYRVGYPRIVAKEMKEKERELKKQMITTNQISEDDKIRTLLHSIDHGDLEMTALILKDTTLDPNEPWAISTLFKAVTAKDNRLELLTILMKSGLEGVDINRTGMDGYTLLHWAATKDCADSAEFLIQQGIEIDAKDEHGQTPLHECASRGCSKMTKVLLEHGADVFAKNKHGDIPLKLANVPTNSDIGFPSGKIRTASLIRQHMDKAEKK